MTEMIHLTALIDPLTTGIQPEEGDLWDDLLAEAVWKEEQEWLRWMSEFSWPLANAYGLYVAQYFRDRKAHRCMAEEVVCRKGSKINRRWAELKKAWRGNPALAKQAARCFVPLLPESGGLLSDTNALP